MDGIRPVLYSIQRSAHGLARLEESVGDALSASTLARALIDSPLEDCIRRVEEVLLLLAICPRFRYAMCSFGYVPDDAGRPDPIDP